jgi:hypothetical protein
VLVSLILVPVFLAILQLGLDLYVRNTLAACAQDAARYAAAEDVDTAGFDAIQGAAHDHARQCINGSLSEGFADDIEGRAITRAVNGSPAVPIIEVKVTAPLPMIGFLGIGGMRISVSGHALQELP